MWNVQTKVIPVTIGLTGAISKSLGIYLCNVPEKRKIKGLQIKTILGTAHILWRVLMYKMPLHVP